MTFARRESDPPSCLHCGQRFELFFDGGWLGEQRCDCGLVYRIEAIWTDQFIDDADANDPYRDITALDG